MKSKLSPWTLNAKKWREENGYTTPEWEMYVQNRANVLVFTALYGLLIGMAIMLCVVIRS